MTALLAMVSATLIQTMGLAKAIARIATKIAGCYVCCTFWICIIALLTRGCEIPEAVVLSIASAWLSHWFVLLLTLATKLYDRLWQRIT